MQFVPPLVSDLPDGDRLGEAWLVLVQEGLCQRGRLRVHLRGNSMWPTIPDGSLVQVEPLSAAGARLGEVVVWSEGGALLAHRVVGRASRGAEPLLRTKGDNASLPDRLVAEGSLLGRVTRIFGHAGGRGRPLVGAYWVWRWRARCLLACVARLSPRSVWPALCRSRDRLGHYLSLGFKALFLR